MPLFLYATMIIIIQYISSLRFLTTPSLYSIEPCHPEWEEIFNFHYAGMTVRLS
jgi:hypothetical protein